jgi:hypothetical protein
MAVLPLLLLSCTGARISYIGNSFTPTKKVDVYVDEKAISKSYTIVGKGYLEPDWRGKLNQEKMFNKTIEKAKHHGADAIFYKETFIPSPGTTIYTVSQSDSIARGLMTKTNSTISSSYGFFHTEVLFLKYR